MCLQKYHTSTTQNIWCPMCTNPRCNTWITREIRTGQGSEKDPGQTSEKTKMKRVRHSERYMEGDTDELISLPCPACIITYRSLAKPPIVFWEQNSYPVLCPGLYDCVCCIVTLFFIQLKLLLLDTEFQGLEIQIHNEAA